METKVNKNFLIELIQRKNLFFANYHPLTFWTKFSMFILNMFIKSDSFHKMQILFRHCHIQQRLKKKFNCSTMHL